jgi:Ca2+-transporting ATPase
MLGCVLCNDAMLQHEKDQWTILGDPTEGALIVLAGKGGVDKEPVLRQMPRVREFPFSSERKRMSVICRAGDKGQGNSQSPYLMFTKGSPELILERCTHIQMGDKKEPLRDEQRTQILEQNNQMASVGLRVLGFSYKPMDNVPPEGSEEQRNKN